MESPESQSSIEESTNTPNSVVEGSTCVPESGNEGFTPAQESDNEELTPDLESDIEESTAAPTDQVTENFDDSTIAAEELVPSEWADEETDDFELWLVVRERLDFIEESQLAGQNSHCPCSLPSDRLGAKTKPLYFSIPAPRKMRNASCSKHPPASLMSVWWLPRWFKAPSIALDIWWPNKGISKPLIKYKKIRRFPDGGKYFHAARSGDIPTIKFFLDSGQCGIEDVGISTGYTALLWAVISCQSKMINFLIEQGANPFYDPFGVQPSPCHLAWDLWLRGFFDEANERALRPLLDQSDYVEFLELPVVHRAVLGLSVNPLEDELLAHPNAVLHLDYQLRTALSWAVACGSESNCTSLLKFGADPNHSDKHNKTPLYLALEYERNGTFEIISALLNAGAKIDPVFSHPKRSTPLLCAAANVEDLRVLSLLLSYGADVNARNRCGETALHLVARWKPAEHAALLMSRGANAFVKDHNGETPFKIALRHKNIGVIGVIRASLD